MRARDFLTLLPRIAIGMIGSGFIAEILPQHLIPSWLGPGTGTAGLMLATFAGALTPGGPVVGFAIATAALKSGAGAPQVIAYTIAWALFALPRVLVFEIPVDAAARGVAARRGLAAAAVPRGVDGDAGGEAVALKNDNSFRSRRRSTHVGSVKVALTIFDRILLWRLFCVAKSMIALMNSRLRAFTPAVEPCRLAQ